MTTPVTRASYCGGKGPKFKLGQSVISWRKSRDLCNQYGSEKFKACDITLACLGVNIRQSGNARIFDMYSFSDLKHTFHSSAAKSTIE